MLTELKKLSLGSLLQVELGALKHLYDSHGMLLLLTTYYHITSILTVQFYYINCSINGRYIEVK